MHFVTHTLAAIALTGALITSAAAGPSATDAAASPKPLVAAKTELDPELERYIPRFVQIESGGNPNARTGSYTGLLQMGPAEIRQYGGKRLEHGRAMLADRAATFEQTHGRQPTGTELYLLHQQGEGGLTAHMRNPDAPAWQNIASTAEGRSRGESWARQAIWGNIPDTLKGEYGSVDNITSQQFMDLWNRKVESTGEAPIRGATTAGTSARLLPARLQRMRPPPARHQLMRSARTRRHAVA